MKANTSLPIRIVSNSLLSVRSLSHRQRDLQWVISVLPRHTLQQIDGFGGSFYRRCGRGIQQHERKGRRQFLFLYFSLRHNYTLARMPIPEL